MSEQRDPAIAILEFESITAGIVAGDAMVKASPVGTIYAGTVHPGRYLVLISGDTASVEEALTAGMEKSGRSVIDRVFLPDVHPDLANSMVGNSQQALFVGEALGIVESVSVASIVDAADAGVKAANVTIAGIRLADGLGGKGYLLYGGVVAEVEAAVEAAVARLEAHGGLVSSSVIAQLHDEMAENLVSDLRFLRRVMNHHRGV